MNPLISLIIPVYNAENDLDKCMESVLAQTYDPFEVILVDDGSTDNSGKMCDAYASRDRRVRTIHQENQGQSAARNHAVQCARGDFIAFVDSDDYVSIEYLDYLWQILKANDADLAVAQYVRVGETSKESAVHYGKSSHVRLDRETAMQRLCMGAGIKPVSYAKLFKRESVKENPFPIGVYYEDVATVYKLFADAETVALGEKVIYYYVQHKTSSLHSRVNEKHMYGLVASENMCRYLCAQYPSLNHCAHFWCCTISMDIIIRILQNGSQKRTYYQEAKTFLGRHFPYVKHLRSVGLVYKIDCILYKSDFCVAWVYFRVRQYIAKHFAGKGNI